MDIHRNGHLPQRDRPEPPVIGQQGKKRQFRVDRSDLHKLRTPIVDQPQALDSKRLKPAPLQLR